MGDVDYVKNYDEDDDNDVGNYYKMSAVKKALSQAAVPNVRLLN